MQSTEPISDENLIKRYEQEIDLYKFYLDMAVKGSLWAFGLTGVLVAYFFTNRQANRLLVWSLLLPVILNVGFFVLFYASIDASRNLKTDHASTCSTLKIKTFDMRPLPALCIILSCMYGAVTIGLLVIAIAHLGRFL